MVTDQIEEARLIELSCAGDETAFTAILDRYQSRIMSYVYRLVGNTHDAEEITFTTFTKCYRALARFDRTKRFSTWLYTIAHRQAIDHLRRNRTDYEYLDETHATPVDPAAQFEQARRYERLEEAIARLAPVDRAIVTLFHKEDHSYAEISEIMGLPVSTIKTRLHRARTKLAAMVRVPGSDKT